MRLLRHHRNLVVWSSSREPTGRSGGRRSARAGRVRWWLRVGGLLAVLGVLRLARAARNCWEPVCLLVGTGLAVAGVVLSIAPAFFLGLLVLILAHIKIATSQRKGPA
jgi:hypothetical protein